MGMNLSTVDVFKHIDSEQCLTLSDDQLSALQDVMRGILFDIVDVCEAHGLRYSMGGGSALGAVRHQDMIPWDDDIDLNMPRRDYERFVEIFAKEHGDRYWVHTPAKTDNYGLLLARVRRKGTYVKTREDFWTDECGAFVDIFIVENVPDAAWLRKLHGLGCMAFGLALSCRKFFRDRKPLMELAKGNKELERVFRVKIALGFVTALLSINAWTRLADKWNGMCRNEQSRYVSIPVGRKHYFKETYRREEICSYQMLPFHGRRVSCVADTKTYMTRLYGADYMTPPKDADKEKHVFLTPFDLGGQKGEEA